MDKVFQVRNKIRIYALVHFFRNVGYQKDRVIRYSFLGYPETYLLNITYEIDTKEIGVSWEALLSDIGSGAVTFRISRLRTMYRIVFSRRMIPRIFVELDVMKSGYFPVGFKEELAAKAKTWARRSPELNSLL